MAYSNSCSIIDELEYQVEYWRRRAEDAERALKGDHWDSKVPPLSLQQTRIMRLIARRPITPKAICEVIQNDYPDCSIKGVLATVSNARRKLPDAIRPMHAWGEGNRYRVPDPDALKAFLEEAA